GGKERICTESWAGGPSWNRPATPSRRRAPASPSGSRHAPSRASTMPFSPRADSAPRSSSSSLVCFEDSGTTLTALARVLGMDRTSLSRNLRPLLRRGFVTTVPATDQRRRTLQTTKRGERLLARTIPSWRRAQQHVVTTVGSDRWATLAGELRGLAKAI